jgi:interleukin-1 receptor-associated kinase 1
VHFDIKPHNILLDEDFCPKISDFGLAKLCKSKVSKVSMIGARGTVDYIAPEVFCRTFGGVSYKSDVYSYGMMVLEMVGERKKIILDLRKLVKCISLIGSISILNRERLHYFMGVYQKRKKRL